MLRSYFNLVQALALCLALSACGLGRQQSFDEFNTLSDTDMWISADERIQPPLFDDAYIIGDKDMIRIDVRDHDEFDVNVLVDNQGEIEIPLIDEPLLLRGLTLEQAAVTVGHFLQPYVKGEVICDIELTATGSKFFYVMGDGADGVRTLGAVSTQGNNQGGNASGASVRKIPMGTDPVYLRDLLLEHEDETDLADITVLRPDFTDRKRPRFMTVDMSGLQRGQWNVNYRIRPNDILIVEQTFKERLLELVDGFVQDVNEVNNKDAQLETTLRLIEARLQNGTAKKLRHSGGR